MRVHCRHKKRCVECELDDKPLEFRRKLRENPYPHCRKARGIFWGFPEAMIRHLDFIVVP